jgi:hypothetical protein
MAGWGVHLHELLDLKLQPAPTVSEKRKIPCADENESFRFDNGGWGNQSRRMARRSLIVDGRRVLLSLGHLRPTLGFSF